MTFTRKYDSNFYFQQAVLNSGQLISKKKKEIQKLKPTKKSILKQTTLIENYAKAYIAKKSMQLGTFKVYPNPNSSEFNQQAEIIQMEATKHFANICQKDFSSDNVATLACCKTEGLISIGSLAICNVFGPDIRDQFKADAVDQPWRLLAAFEMLYNLKMHQNDNKIKTKYLERLDNILKNGPNSCKEQLRTQITKDILKIKASKDTKKKIDTTKALVFIHTILEDEKNGSICITKRTSSKNIDEDINTMRTIISKYAAVKTEHPQKAKYTMYVLA